MIAWWSALMLHTEDIFSQQNTPKIKERSIKWHGGKKSPSLLKAGSKAVKSKTGWNVWFPVYNDHQTPKKTNEKMYFTIYQGHKVNSDVSVVRSTIFVSGECQTNILKLETTMTWNHITQNTNTKQLLQPLGLLDTVKY